jgi:ribonucleases P/MRP protein subunit RPP40
MERTSGHIWYALYLTYQHTILTQPAVIRISVRTQSPALKDETCHVVGEKVTKALDEWDSRRGPWDVVYDTSGVHDTNAQLHAVQPEVRIQQSVHVPRPKICQRPKDRLTAEEWDEDVTELFEWVGLACLGSERFVFLLRTSG